MSDTKKVKKKKFNLLKFLVFLLFLYIIINLFIKLYKVPIKNIIILNNNYLSDDMIIEVAELEKYPSYLKSTSSSICKKIKKIELVEDCKVKKKLDYRVEISIIEKKILYKMRSNNKYILNDGGSLDSDIEYSGVPVLINYVTDEIFTKLNRKFSKLDKEVLMKISEIEYSPSTYDKERFILYMIDKNMVYITLSSADKLNKYNEIKKELERHSGILYLDSGNYFEIKD